MQASLQYIMLNIADLLTLKALNTAAADHILKYLFFILQRLKKTRQTIRMKSYISLRKNNNKFRVSSAIIMPCALTLSLP